MSATTAAGIVPLLFESTERRWCVTGSRDQLCESGHCVPAHFPIGRKRLNSGRDCEGRWWSVEAKRGGRWLLEIERTPTERAAWVEADAVRQARAVAPRTPEEWRGLKAAYVAGISASMRLVLTDAGPRSGGFALSSDSLRQVEWVLSALERVFENAEVVRHVGLSADDEPQASMPRARAPLRLVVNGR